MSSFGRQFDYHDAIYQVQPCYVDNRRRNVDFTTNGLSKTYTFVKNVFQPKYELRETLTLCSRCRNGFVHIFNLLVC